MKNCLGCSLAHEKENVYVIYEDQYITCILDHIPHHPGHTLILPKKHKEEVTEFTDAESLSIMKASQLISRVIHTLYEPKGITICQNGGVFSDLNHYHMHVVPRNEEEALFGELFYGNGEIIEPFETLKETHEKMKNCINTMLEEEPYNDYT
ncbi:HIT family protein [Bacillus sp. KH172YL63]|uniref:HIT family protein n=1 Tax=Bacillus sp. KH172YL63 TaxID=2709784 RepID=UPI0013E472D1|nr:HIT family protein [Bacillus sp. KH172YL63]BCB03747.1 HIT family protein [Bacillus sp. KH172YL63]